MDPNGKGMTIFAAKRERKTCGVAKAIWRSMQDLGDHGQKRARFASQLREPIAVRQNRWVRIPRRRLDYRAGAPRQHVAGAYVMMGRHHQMRQCRLLWIDRLDASISRGLQPGEFVRDFVRSQGPQHSGLIAARRFGASVGEVDDHTLVETIDRRVRLFDEAL